MIFLLPQYTDRREKHYFYASRREVTESIV